MHVPYPKVTGSRERNRKIDGLFAKMLNIEPVQSKAKNMFMAKSEFEKLKQSNGN